MPTKWDSADSDGQIRHADKAPPEIQRRLLDFFNGARVPEDLLKPPQLSRGTAGGEHYMIDHHGPHLGHGKSDNPWKNAGLDRELATKIIDWRPPYGWRELGTLYKYHERFTHFTDKFIPLLGPYHFGTWEMPVCLPTGDVNAVQNAAVLHSWHVLMLTNGTSTILWNPMTNDLRSLPRDRTGLTANLFCSGHSFLSDGRLLVVGGGGGSPEDSLASGWKFDPATETWAPSAGSMSFPRWYPTALTLGAGSRVLVASGVDSEHTIAPQMELYSEGTDSFTTVTASGEVGEKTFPQMYPGLHLLPAGQVFYAPTGFGDCYQTVAPYPSTEPSGYFSFSGANAGAWHDLGANVRTKGMSVLLQQSGDPTVQVLVVGGGDAASTATGQLINLSTLEPIWGHPFPLLYPRLHPNVVLLPDGKVFICGGMEEIGTPPTGGPCELYDPVAGTLTEMAAVGYPRHYHSFAVLLPTGEVMVAGGAREGGCSLSVENMVEVYSPPYLFRGDRPKISAAPEDAAYGESVFIETAEGAQITRAVLVRPMAVTHQTDTEQRVVPLAFTANGAGLSATMPTNMNIAPRGYYMLFIVNNLGVPSVATFVRLH